MSEYVYKSGLTTIPANRFQPDCCSSLTYAWLSAMGVSEQQGEAWCARANLEPENGPFYAHHIARNDLIQAKTKIANTRRAYEVGKIMGEVGLANTDLSIVLAARDIVQAIGPALNDQRNKKSETDAQGIMGFRVVQRWADNVEMNLHSCLRTLSPSKKFYTLAVKAGNTGHVVAIVSTKAEGWFSPSGYLYYYDPNLKRVVQTASREDLIHFMDTLKADYQGFRVLTELAVA